MEKKSATRQDGLREQRSGRRLDHDADLDVLVELTTLFGKLGLALLDELLDSQNLLDAGDERITILTSPKYASNRARSWTLYWPGWPGSNARRGSP